MFGHDFSVLGVDVLALKCDPSFTVANYQKKSACVLEFEDSLKTASCNASFAEGFAGFGVSITPNYKRFIVTPNLGGIIPRLSSTFSSQGRLCGFEAKIPLATGGTTFNACVRVSEKAQDFSLAASHDIPIMDGVRGTVDLLWQYPKLPMIAFVAQVKKFAVLGLIDEKYKTMKAHLKFDNFLAFWEATEEDSITGHKIGAVMTSDAAEVGALANLAKGFLKLKSEVGCESWSVCSMTRFDGDGTKASIGCELNLLETRLRCLTKSSGVVVGEVKLPFGKKGIIKVGMRYKKSKVMWGAKVKFDHR